MVTHDLDLQITHQFKDAKKLDGIQERKKNFPQSSNWLSSWKLRVVCSSELN